MTSLPFARLSRLRQTPASRALVRETSLSPAQLIAPLFIYEGLKGKRAIASMQGQYQLGLDALIDEALELKQAGINAVILFGIPLKKDDTGSDSFNDDGIVQKAIRLLKKHIPDLLVISDICFCEYTSHGHCGALNHQCIDTDKTLALLAKQAVSHARAGADWLAPSGMTDGMVLAIRNALDEAGFSNKAILSYSAKYCSCLYGPFRDAAEGAPQFGDRSAYQMDIANAKEALRESAEDVIQGADMLMVKPAQYYLDIIYRIKEQHPDVPLCAYQVSGEYAMIKAAAEKGFIDEDRAIIESLLSIKRAGADFIITYFAKKYGQLFSS